MKIQDLLNQAKPFWKYAATDEDGKVYFYSAKPIIYDNFWCCASGDDSARRIDELFDIEPFEGDWKDSLICREECGLWILSK